MPEALRIKPVLAYSNRVAHGPGWQPFPPMYYAASPTPASARFLERFFVSHVLLPISGVRWFKIGNRQRQPIQQILPWGRGPVVLKLLEQAFKLLYVADLLG